MSDNNKHLINQATAPSVEELISIFRQSSEKISTLHTYSSSDFKVLRDHIRRYYEQATTIFGTMSELAAGLTTQEQYVSRQAEDSLKDISSIVTKLQFHDIIRQQLEHIEQTNNTIVIELQGSADTTNPQQGPHNHYLSIIPEIARLHVAQLTHTNLEYQSTFAVIKATLQSIGGHSKAIADICTLLTSVDEAKNAETESVQPQAIRELANKLSIDIEASLIQIKYCESFEKLVKEINGQLNALCSLTIVKSAKKLTAEESTVLTQLKQLYTMESERIVHDMALSKKHLSKAKLKNINPTDTDNNLELF